MLQRLDANNFFLFGRLINLKANKKNFGNMFESLENIRVYDAPPQKKNL